MPSVRTTAAFDNWINALRDRVGRDHILRRVARLAQGNPGDVGPVGGRVSEMRINVGPGYRVYYIERNDGTLVILLGGGDQSTQVRDIARARALAATV